MSESIAIIVAGLFRGGAGAALADGTASGIFKQPATAAVALGRAGLAGDHQADRVNHGGADKALHHYPAEHFAALAARFPAAAALLAPGSIGENVSTYGLTEQAVRIGDEFTLGGARIQVTQPRRPCWKIDRRYDTHGLAAWIVASGTTGWYYRVLEPGAIAAGDRLVLVARDDDAPSIAEFHAATAAARPSPATLQRLLEQPALPTAWRRRLRQRIDWLARRR